MTTSHKIRCSIRIEEDVYRAAQERARRRDQPLSEILADAAKRDLCARQIEEQTLLGHMQQLLISQRKAHMIETFDLHVLKEMIGLFVQAFYNHIPPVAESQKADAQRSGQIRYEHFIEVLARNIRDRQSALSAMQVASAASQSIESDTPHP